MKRKLLATLLTLAMILSLLPTAAFAAEGAVAQIGDETYTTLQEAIDVSGSEGTEIKLIGDTTESVTISSGNITLDLNGRQINCNQYGTGNNNYIGAINVTGGSLTIKDTSDGEGKVLGSQMAVVVRDGNLTIESGTFGRSDAATYYWKEPLLIGGGTGVINGGTFVDGSVEFFLCFETDEGSLTVNGGQFDSLPYFVAAEGAQIWAPDEDSYITAYPTFEAFANANSSSFTYDSTENVLKMVSAYSAKIDNYGDQGGFFFNDDVTLDLNDQTWALSDDNLIIINGGAEVALKDSSDSGNGKITNSDQTVVHTMGTLNLQGGTLELNLTKYSYSGNSAVIVDDNGILNMTDGKIVVNADGKGQAYGVSDTQYSVENTASYINIFGGTITMNTTDTNSSRNAAVYINSQIDTAPTYCTISGDAVLKTVGTGLYCTYYNATSATNPSYIKITGGSFDGPIGCNSTKSVTEIYQITGGRYAEDISDFVSKSVTVTDTRDGTDTPFQIEINADDTSGVVAKVGDRYYTSIADAASEAGGRPIVLLADASGTVIISDFCSFSIDANGYQNNLTFEAGEAYALSEENGLYTVKGDLSAATIKASGYQQYNGKPITLSNWSVTVTWNGKRLTAGTDYTLAYENNIDAGNDAVVIANGTGDYTVSVQTNFTISRTFVTLSGTPVIEGWTYGEEPNQPSGVTVTSAFGADTLHYIYCDTLGGLYTDEQPKTAGTWYVRAEVPTGRNWSNNASSTVSFVIAKASAPTIDDVTVSFSAAQATGKQSVLMVGAPADAGTTTYTTIDGSITDEAGILSGTPAMDDSGNLCFTFADNVEAGKTATIPVKATMQNYEDATFNVIISLNSKEDQTAPASFEMTFTLNDDEATYTAVIPVVEGAEYSFDGVTWSETNTKTDVDPKTSVTGYIRFPGSDEKNPSPTTSSTQTAPALQVKMPTAEPAGGEFADTVTVTLTTATEGATVYYTTDGTDPTPTNGTRCFSPITISETTTIKACALKNGMDPSEIMTVTFTKKSEDIPTYAVTVAAADNGAVTAVPANALVGDTITVTTSPVAGYQLSSLTVTDANGTPQALTNVGNGVYTFSMPGSNVTVVARYAVIPGGGTSTGGSGSGSSGSSGYTVTITKSSNGAVTASDRKADRGDTVTLTVKPDSGYALDDLTVTDRKGNRVELTDRGNGKFAFTMPGGAVTVKAAFARIPEQSGVAFADVPNGAYYRDAVVWAVENGITGGTTATTFSPDAPCTRAQAVTFLWRAAGSPAPGSRVNPFTDVASGAYYYDAVLWAVENGITTGTTAATFSPDVTVTRCQAVTFQHRAAGSPAAGIANAFTDVASNAYYVDAVRWAVENGVTNGATATAFRPDAPCTRAQIVTFLYRADA